MRDTVPWDKWELRSWKVLRQSKRQLEKNFQTQGISEWSEFIKNSRACDRHFFHLQSLDLL